MTLQEIFHDKHLLLPKAIPKDKSYRSFLNELFDKYLSLLQQVQERNIKIAGLKEINFSNVVKIQEEFVKGLQKTIEIYFDGQPAEAYTRFAEVIEDRKGIYKKILNTNQFAANENFYRIRVKQENFPLSCLEMFHIPFHFRGKVTTQRYSIPGFPSLYLGKTLYVAWEELNRPNLDGFQAVRLVSQKPITYLDLTTNDWGTDNLNKEAYKYLMTWPLIAACSIKVKDYSDTFKPEYIIPQLLLQWVRNSGEIDGIKYSSTHIEMEELKAHGDLYNVVLPVKENKDDGHCNHLMSLFKITETISRQLLDYSSGGQLFKYSDAEYEAIDRKIPALEIINGKKSPYSHSVLGYMELILDGMQIKNIE
jgi:hypothetical protein